MTEHRCQGMNDLQSELDVARNLLRFGWFVPSNSDNLPRFPPRRLAAIQRWATVRQPPRVRVPVQRSRAAAEAEERLFDRFPRPSGRTDTNDNRGR